MTPATFLPIQMLWIDGPLSNLERLAIASCIRNGHPVHLYTYGSPGNAPAGTTILDAGEILAYDPDSSVRGSSGYGSLAPFSNRFRYKLLFERGGIWCDTDVVLLKPLTFAAEMEHFFATEFDVEQAGSDKLAIRASSCAMRVPAGSELMKECYEEAMAINPNHAGWGATGIQVLRKQLERRQLGESLLHPNVICPVPFWDIAKLLTGLHTLPAESHAIHFYNEMLRRNFFDKNGTYEPHCVYERLKAYYLGQAGTA